MLEARPENRKGTSCPGSAVALAGDPGYAEVLARFRKSASCPAGWPDDWTPDCPPQVRRESTIHRLSSQAMGTTICVKIVNRPSRRVVDSKRLHAALTHYHARSDHERGFTVPRPYACFPKLGAVIMEWVEGRTFADLLKADQFNTRRRHENISRVAGWLRWFHTQSEMLPGNVAAADQLDGIVKVFEEHRDLDKGAMSGDAVLERQMALAARHVGLLDGVEVELANLHGDFKPTNLLFSAQGHVVGIDFFGVKRGPVTRDIFRFLIDLDFYRNLVSCSYALSPGSRSNDFEAFLSAYGGKAVEIPRPAFLYLYFLAVLSALVHQRKKFTPAVGMRFRIAVFRSIARQLSRTIGPGETSSPERRGTFSWLRLLRMRRSGPPEKTM